MTGNYNFFNLLTAILLLIILDDRFAFKWTPKWVWRVLDIEMPMECLVDNLKEENLVASKSRGFSWFFRKLRALLGYTSIAVFLYFCATKFFPYTMVKEGKMFFKYEDLKAAMNDKKLVLTVIVVLFNLMVF